MSSSAAEPFQRAVEEEDLIVMSGSDQDAADRDHERRFDRDDEEGQEEYERSGGSPVGIQILDEAMLEAGGGLTSRRP